MKTQMAAILKSRSERDETPPKVKTIVVEVYQGVVSDVVNIPHGVEVLIKDLDAEAMGSEYSTTVYENDEGEVK